MRIEVNTVNSLYSIVGDCNLMIKSDIQDGEDVGICEIEIPMIYYLNQKFHSALLSVNYVTLLISLVSTCKIRCRCSIF